MTLDSGDERSKIKVTLGRRAGKDIRVGTGAAKSNFSLNLKYE